jgi:hypothetical protein
MTWSHSLHSGGSEEAPQCTPSPPPSPASKVETASARRPSHLHRHGECPQGIVYTTFIEKGDASSSLAAHDCNTNSRFVYIYLWTAIMHFPLTLKTTQLSAAHIQARYGKVRKTACQISLRTSDRTVPYVHSTRGTVPEISGVPAPWSQSPIAPDWPTVIIGARAGCMILVSYPMCSR